MSGFGVVVFVIIAILAAFSNAKKAGQGTGAPRPGTRPPPRPGTPGQAGTSQATMEQSGSVPPELQRAADLVPDDLWAILTGERRAPQRPLQTPHTLTLPAPQPRRSVTEPLSLSQQGEAELAREEQELLAQKRAQLAGTMGAEVARSRAPGAAASQPSPAPAAPPASGAAAEVVAPRKRSRGLLSGPADLRRAMVLRTVLGAPKSLE